MNRLIDSFFEYVKRSDRIFWVLCITTSLFGLAMVYSSATPSEFLTQVLATLLGYVAIIIISVIDYEQILRFLPLIAVFSIFLLILTVFWGVGPEGSQNKAWLPIFNLFTFQPSELMKFTFILTFGYHLSYLIKYKQLNHIVHVLILLIHLGFPIVLIRVCTKDDGSALVFLFIALAMLVVSGLKLRYFAVGGALLVALVPLVWRYVFNDFQKQRFMIIADLEQDPLHMGYHQIQTKISIGSGQLFGKGLFNGPRTAKGIVPEDHNDMIFSVVGEELGFIGCVLVLLLLFFLLFRLIRIAGMSRDNMGSIICFGFFGMIAFQTIENIGMCMGLLPVIGITLPFFSAGGSSTICLYMIVGLIQSVYIHRNEFKLRV